MTKWKFLIGSGILAGGLLLKAGAPVPSIVLGMVLAAVVTWKVGRPVRRPSR